MMNRSQKMGFIYILLKGYFRKDKDGLSAHRFLDGEYEQIARDLLAEELRSGRQLPQRVLNALADLIVSGPKPFQGDPFQPRKLDFKFRTRGNRINHRRQSEIFAFMSRLVDEGWKVEAAAEETLKRFRLKRAYVMELWSKYNAYKKASEVTFRGVLSGLIDEK